VSAENHLFWDRHFTEGPMFQRGTEEAIEARPQKLIQALRLFPDPTFDPAIRSVGTDDLESFLGVIDMQLTNTPLHVKDPIRLEESMRNFHHARTVVAQVLANKRLLVTQKERRSAKIRATIATTTSIIAILIASVSLWWSLTHSGLK
jgi:hypothetical protein